MIKRIVLWVVIVAVLIGAAWYIYQKYGVTDEARVERVVDRMAAGLETGNTALSVLRISSYLSSTYRHNDDALGVPRGGLDKSTVKAYILRLRRDLGYHDFDVELSEVTVTVTDDTAQAIVTGRITALPKGENEERVELMTSPGLNRAVLDFAKEDGDWMVVRSRRVAHDLDDAEQP